MYPSHLSVVRHVFHSSGRRSAIKAETKAKTLSNTDHQQRNAVMTQFDWKPEAPCADIGVSVSKGVVTLTGFVNTYSEKLAAEKAVKLVRGILLSGVSDIPHIF